MVGTSEKISDNLNPDFTHNFNLNFSFQLKMFLIVEVWDIDPSGKEFLGKCSFEIGEIIGNKKKYFERYLQDTHNKNIHSSLLIRWERA